MATMDSLFISIIALGILIGAVSIYSINTTAQHEEDYGLGSAVTTTAEYEILTNDSFTGVVVRGQTRDDIALTLRNRDGEERRIATEFLEPMW